MSRKWIALSLAWIVLYLMGFIGVSAAYAQTGDPPQDTPCWSCHETEYQCREHGKWCCFSNPHRYCTDCHGGDDTTWNKDQAHLGIVYNPIAENPAVCQECHPEDAAARIEQFAAMAALDLSATPAPTRTLSPTAAPIAIHYPAAPTLRLPQEPWRVAGLALVGVLFVIVLLLGYRCWKADCLTKTLHS